MTGGYRSDTVVFRNQQIDPWFHCDRYSASVIAGRIIINPVRRVVAMVAELIALPIVAFVATVTGMSTETLVLAAIVGMDHTKETGATPATTLLGRAPAVNPAGRVSSTSIPVTAMLVLLVKVNR